jgi:hypothetical protein
VLDDVERRRFLVEPARKHPLPAPVGKLDVELHEGTRQGLVLPRCGGFAGSQADHRVADAHRLARPQRDVANDPVALVEQAQDGDPLRHRRYAGLGACRGSVGRGGGSLARRLALGLPLAVAPRRTQREQAKENEPAAHAQSGIHGW